MFIRLLLGLSEQIYAQIDWVKPEQTQVCLSNIWVLARSVMRNRCLIWVNSFCLSNIWVPTRRTAHNQCFLFNWSLFCETYIVKLGWLCGILLFFNLPSVKFSYSALSLINLTHFSKWVVCQMSAFKTEEKRWILMVTSVERCLCSLGIIRITWGQLIAFD